MPASAQYIAKPLNGRAKPNHSLNRTASRRRWRAVRSRPVSLVIGLLVTIDDGLPGGFSNPNDNSRCPWREWESWADLAARAAISGLGFAIDNAWNTPAAVVAWVVGATGVVSSALVHQRIAKKIVPNGGNKHAPRA